MVAALGRLTDRWAAQVFEGVGDLGVDGVERFLPLEPLTGRAPARRVGPGLPGGLPAAPGRPWFLPFRHLPEPPMLNDSAAVSARLWSFPGQSRLGMSRKRSSRPLPAMQIAVPMRWRTFCAVARMQALGLKFLGPQMPHGRRAKSVPYDVPSDTKNVPTFYPPGSGPESAVNQLDYVFASHGFHESVSVLAMNEVEEWGPSDHCRLMIDVKTNADRS